jgi:tRNA(Ile)-lysidine synthase
MSEMKRLHNFFIDTKVPREWRDRVPLLVGEQGIAWVVGYRIAEWAKVPDERSPDTPILRVRFTLNNE